MPPVKTAASSGSFSHFQDPVPLSLSDIWIRETGSHLFRGAHFTVTHIHDQGKALHLHVDGIVHSRRGLPQCVNGNARAQDKKQNKQAKAGAEAR